MLTTSDLLAGAEAPLILRLFAAPPNEQLWTLRQFFDEWFRVHLARERKARPGTIKSYEEALAWWEKFTANPSLLEVTRETLKDFRDALESATYQRGRFKHARKYPLSEARRLGVQTSIRTMLAYCGPETERRRETAGILPTVPFISIPKYDGQPKENFSLATARLLAAHCRLMTEPRIAGVAPGAWCYAILCGLVQTGLRRGTVSRLRWSMVTLRDGRPWLTVPNEDVSKTRKGTRIAVHPELWQAWQAIRTESPFIYSIDRYQSRPRRAGGSAPRFRDDRIRLLLGELQRLAGVPQAAWLSPQAWRRTHLDWLDTVGYAAGKKLMQGAADHGSSDTTEGFYVDAENKYRRKLPWLRPELKPKKSAPPDLRQRRLFD
jgi:integrase